MPTWISGILFLFAFLQTPTTAPPKASVSAQAFVGTWVGTQAWAIASPPPGANPEQPVSITIAVTDGKITGFMTPFLGGQDGATFTDARIVGDELVASAMVGAPKPAAGGRGAAAAVPAAEEEGPAPAAGKGKSPANRPTWKDAVKVQFVFKNDGLDLKGNADLMMNDVKWTRLSYTLSKKRSRY